MKNAKKYIWWILTLLMMIVIFRFSSEKAVDSADTSKGFIRMLLDILPFTKDMTEIAKQEIILFLDFIVRKCAHFTLYAMLGFTVFGAVKSTFVLLSKENINYSFLISFIYAITDEVHQYFVPGRACRLYDIAIDSLGSIFGISIFLLMVYLSNKRLYKKAKQ